jgi:hypothetical protein
MLVNLEGHSMSWSSWNATVDVVGAGFVRRPQYVVVVLEGKWMYMLHCAVANVVGHLGRP